MSGLKISYVCSAVGSRSRAPNFTSGEKRTLLDIISQYRHIIDKKESDATTVKDKAACWQKIAVEFNEAFPIRIREARQLRKCYENHKKRSRKAGDQLAAVKAEPDAACDVPCDGVYETALNSSQSHTDAEDSLSFPGSVGYVSDKDSSQTGAERYTSSGNSQEVTTLESARALNHCTPSPQATTGGNQAVPHAPEATAHEYMGPQLGSSNGTAPHNHAGTSSDDIVSTKCAYLRQKTKALKEEHKARMSILRHGQEYARLQVEIAKVELAKLREQLEQRTESGDT